FWELKENWRLYRSNRPAALQPVTVGHHGETMLQLLRPGFHSGTVPHLYDRLRHEELQAARTGLWRAARTCRHRLEEGEESVRVFVEREFLAVLRLSGSWRDQVRRLGAVELATRLIRARLEHDGYPGQAVRLAFVERSGWLLARVEETGWLPQLPQTQRAAL